MADWIDDLAGKQNDAERRLTTDKQHDLHSRELTEAALSAFWHAFEFEIKNQANELDQKAGGMFGGVRPQNTDPIRVETGKGHKVAISKNVPARKIVAEIKRPNPVDVGVKLTFEFSAEVGSNRVTISETLTGQRFTEADVEGVATLILKTMLMVK